MVKSYENVVVLFRFLFVNVVYFLIMENYLFLIYGVGKSDLNKFLFKYGIWLN